jgi:hypothetical protein
VADGSCDLSCNISECSFDGGDCNLSTEDDIGLYDENRHLANYDDDDDTNSYNGNKHHYARESFNDNVFHNMNFGGDIILEDLPESGKRMNSLLDILIRKNIKKNDFKGNLSYFREDEEMNYLNPNDNRNVDVDNTTPFTYSHNTTSKFHHYEWIKLYQENTASHDTENNNPQQHEKVYGRKENDTLYLQRTAHFQQRREDNKNSNNSLVLPGSNLIFHQKHNHYKNNNLLIKTVMRNNNNGTSTEHTTQSLVNKLFGNSSTDLRDYHINDAEGHKDFYHRLPEQDTSYRKVSELKRNGSNVLVVMGKWQDVQSTTFDEKNVNHNISYSIEKFRGRFNESHNIHIAAKSDQAYGPEKIISSQTVKHKPVRDVSSYSAKVHKLYQKLNGKSDEGGKLYAKHNPNSADKNIIGPKLQHTNYDVDWENEEKVSKFSKRKQKAVRMYDAQQYGSSPSVGRKPRDTFAESLLYVNRLYNQEFGFEPRKVPAHMPHLIDIDIMEQLQAR